MASGVPSADPEVVMDTMAKNLGRTDRFYLRALRRLIGREPDPPSGTVKKVGHAMHVSHGPGNLIEVTPAQLNLNAWDEAQERYRALDRRITFNLEYYNELLAQLRTMSGSDREHIENRVETAEAQLCSDFRDMVSLDERVLQMSLPDHYWLERICGPRYAPLT
jgi:hypothetical protein